MIAIGLNEIYLGIIKNVCYFVQFKFYQLNNLNF